MFSWRSHKENAELTERFSLSENVRLMQDLPGIHRLVKLTVNEGFLAVLFSFFSSRCFLKEIENMYFVFLSSYTNTRETSTRVCITR